MKQIAVLLLLLAVLSGCGGQATPLTATAVTPAAPSPTAAAVRTASPAATSPAAPGYPSPPTASPGEAYPPAGTAAPGYPYPAAQALAADTAAPSPQPGASFRDCARTPGLAGCAPNTAPLTGSLSFFDASTARVVGLDLRSGAGWQVPFGSGAPAVFAWSPDGQKLLAAQGNGKNAVFSAQGSLLDTFTLPADNGAVPTWQPDGSLSKDGSVHAADGSTARLEHSASDMRWTLTVKPAGGAQRSLPVEQPSADILYKLLAWVPGTQNLLAQAYYASNQAMTQGGQLAVIDATSGAVQAWKASISLEASNSFAWDPAQPSLLALLETGDTGVTAPRLALLDSSTGQARYPLPDGILVSGLAWQPGGQQLAFAARPLEGASAEASKIIPGAGIYLLAPQSGQVTPLAPSPAGTVDGWPRWSADGSLLVYARAIGEIAQVRARRVSDGQEWVLVDGLTGLQQRLGSPAWGSLLAFSNR